MPENSWLAEKKLASQEEPRSEVPATGHLDTGFSWFPCVYKQTLQT